MDEVLDSALRRLARFRSSGIADSPIEMAAANAVLALPLDQWSVDGLRTLGIDAITAGILLTALRKLPESTWEDLLYAMSEVGPDDVLAALHRDMAGETGPNNMPVMLGLIASALEMGGLADLTCRSSSGDVTLLRAVIDAFSGEFAVTQRGAEVASDAAGMLLDAGASITARTFGGVPVLPYAVCRGVPIALLTSLLDAGANPNEPVGGAGAAHSRNHGVVPTADSPLTGTAYLAGGTAMHHAAIVGSYDAMTLLMSEGGRLDVKSHEGYVPLSVAGATTTRTSHPPHRMVDRTCMAAAVWLLYYPAQSANVPSHKERRRYGEFMMQVLAIRLEEAGLTVTASELDLYRCTASELARLGCDLRDALSRRPSWGGATFGRRVAASADRALIELNKVVGGSRERRERVAQWGAVKQMMVDLSAENPVYISLDPALDTGRAVWPIKRATDGSLPGDTEQQRRRSAY
ncbi:MAG: hypothetical protein P4M06_12215 [Pandoraea sp.]|nr:hypothetical protein [Pandoraea sp.]MDR3398313.1 hypothetical protein [Pandoraea sp.]